MKYEDLYEFPEGHPPSPYEIPVYVFGVGELWLPEGLPLYAIGWIEETGFATGDIPGECVDALVAAYPDKIVSDGTRGWHTCTFCEVLEPGIKWNGEEFSVKGYGHYLVRYENAVYMAPALLLHYILDHNYLPPKEFTDAVINGAFLTTEDLEVRES